MHIVQTDSLGIPAVPTLRGVSNLQEMAFSHCFANRGVRILYLMAQRINLAVEVASRETGIEHDKDLHRHAHAPISFFSPEIENLLPTYNDPTQNSIFSPFPAQVLPLQAFMTQLRDAGFEFVIK
jgi:hypothetical protein